MGVHETAGTHSELYHGLAAFETVRSERVACSGGLSLILDDHGEVVQELPQE